MRRTKKTVVENPLLESAEKWNAYRCVLENDGIFFLQPPEVSRAYYMNDTKVQQDLLFSYARIDSMSKAMEWVELHGAPIPYSGIIYGDTRSDNFAEWIGAREFLLESAASWKWFLDLARAAFDSDVPKLERLTYVTEIGKTFSVDEEHKIPYELAKVARFWLSWRSYALRQSNYAVAFMRPFTPLYSGLVNDGRPARDFLNDGNGERADVSFMSLLSDSIDDRLLLTCRKSHWDNLDYRGDLVVLLAKEYLRRIVNHMLQGITQTLEWDLQAQRLRPEFKVTCPWNAMVMGFYSYLLDRTSHHKLLCPRCGSMILGRADKKHCGKSACAKWVQRNRK